MTSRSLSLATLAILAGLTTGCTSGNCVDDGFVWNQNDCPATASVSASASEGDSESDSDSDPSPTDTNTTPGTNTNSTPGTNTNATPGTNTEPDSDPTVSTVSDTDTSDTEGVSESDTANTESASDTDPGTNTDTNTNTDTTPDTDGDGTLVCTDADGDGFGDPTMCTSIDRGEEPPPGSVPNDDDCDDADANTFPGAAPNDSDTACMTDADGDDWGDSSPSAPDAAPGTDCDDDNAAAFPGAAANEVDPDACMVDADGDGWGEAQPGGGIVGGLDCYDNNPNFNPEDRIMFTVPDNGLPLGRVSEIDTTTGVITPFANLLIPLGSWEIYSAAVSPIDGKIYGANSATLKRRLVTFDYCDVANPVEELAQHGESVCGLAFTADGTLYGINSGDDELVTFDTATGAILTRVDLKLGGQDLPIGSCGMAYDCLQDRLLVTDGDASRILSIAPDGAATVLSNFDLGQWTSVGAEFDPVTARMFVINGNQSRDFWDMSLVDDNFEQLPDISEAANDLTYGPVCP